MSIDACARFRPQAHSLLFGEGKRMNKEKAEYYAHLSITLITAGALLYIFFRYLFFVTLPFLLAWGVAFALRPVSVKISAGIRIPRRIVSAVLTVFIVLGGMSIAVSALIYALGQAWDFLSRLAGSDALYDVLSRLMNPISGLLGDFDGAEQLEEHIDSAIKGALTSVLSELLGGVTAFISSVPRVFIFILVTVISSVYFSVDLDRINAFVLKILPRAVSERLIVFKDRFLKTLVKYLRSYLVIMLVTFIVMLFGFLLLNVPYAVLLAFLVSLLDALPLIGVGTVLVPWSIYQIIFGEPWLGIGLLVLFVAHEVIRQFAEPKILGKSLGIHPIVSLVLLYVGYCCFGFLGLLLIPIFVVFINILMPQEGDENINGK